jgi:hypothetical protein
MPTVTKRRQLLARPAFRTACDIGLLKPHRLPDGSGCFTASLPLPKTHWLYNPPRRDAPPMTMRMEAGAMRAKVQEAVRQAVRYGLRAATRNGQDKDFDPDALEQNIIVGLLGYHTDDGLSEGTSANPAPVPPLCRVIWRRKP